jgi:hypothetical protein
MSLRAEVEKRIGLLETAGFKCMHRRRHAVEFGADSRARFYLPNTIKASVVLSPARFSIAKLVCGIAGVNRFNSNFASFPKQKNNGKNPERYGVGFDLPDDSYILPFLDAAFGAH